MPAKNLTPKKEAPPTFESAIERLESIVEQMESNELPLEDLLVRYEELQRTNALLGAQVDALTQERDSLKSRLSAARARVDGGGFRRSGRALRTAAGSQGDGRCVDPSADRGPAGGA